MRKRILTAVPAVALLLGTPAAIAGPGSDGAVSSPEIVLPESLLTGQPTDAPIDVKFVTSPDTSVNLASLRIWLREFIGWVDVTEQLLRHPRVRVSGRGIHLDGGVL